MSDLSESLAKELLKEMRARRRWSLFSKIFFSTIFLIIFFTTFSVSAPKTIKKDHAALIKIKGVILDSNPANIRNITAGLKKAFENEKVKGIILKINSRGGTPVLSDDIYTTIKRFKAKYPSKKIYAVCSEVCASGAYYIACAADEIYANRSSLVGSIGVVSRGFGFVDSLNKLGVERRLYTAGDSKGLLDPFLPLEKDQAEFFQTILTDVHKQFIKVVKENRGQKLAKDQKIFTGLFWSGVQAKKLGLIDGFGNADYVAKELIKVNDIVNYTVGQNFLDKLIKELNKSTTQTLATALSYFNATIY